MTLDQIVISVGIAVLIVFYTCFSILDLNVFHNGLETGNFFDFFVYILWVIVLLGRTQVACCPLQASSLQSLLLHFHALFHQPYSHRRESDSIAERGSWFCSLSVHLCLFSIFYLVFWDDPKALVSCKSRRTEIICSFSLWNWLLLLKE